MRYSIGTTGGTAAAVAVARPCANWSALTLVDMGIAMAKTSTRVFTQHRTTRRREEPPT